MERLKQRVESRGGVLLDFLPFDCPGRTGSPHGRPWGKGVKLSKVF